MLVVALAIIAVLGFMIHTEKKSVEPVAQVDPLNTDSWETYTNEKYGVSVKYPPGAELRIEKETEESDITFNHDSVTFSDGPIVKVSMRPYEESQHLTDKFNGVSPMSVYGGEIYFCGPFSIKRDVTGQPARGVFYCDDRGKLVTQTFINNNDKFLYKLHFRDTKQDFAFSNTPGIKELIKITK